MGAFAPVSGRTDQAPSPKELAAHLNRIRPHHLSAFEKAGLDSLDSKQRMQFSHTLDALEAVKDGKLPPQGYMTAVMQSAADLAGKDGPEFVRLVHMSFSQHLEGAGSLFKSALMLAGRYASGGGISFAGQMLETTYLALVGEKNTTSYGINANVADGIDPKSTLTHHFGEFIQVGARRPRDIAYRASTACDVPGENPGDVRNSHFAIMLGAALQHGQCTPQQAVDLTRWAFLQNAPGEPPPPWGDTPDTSFFTADRYHIKDWLSAYAKAHPAGGPRATAATLDDFKSPHQAPALAAALADGKLSDEEWGPLAIAIIGEGAVASADSRALLNVWGSGDIQMSGQTRTSLGNTLKGIGYDVADVPTPGVSPRAQIERAVRGQPGEQDALLARLLARSGKQDVKVPVAVVDGRVDAKHPELEGKLQVVREDGEDVKSGSVSKKDLKKPDGGLQHGTQIAGLVTAGTNDLPLIFEQAVSNDLSPEKIARAIDDAAAHGARVVNLSFAAQGDATGPIADAIRRHPDVLFVKSAGNEGQALHAGRGQLSELSLPNLAVVAWSDEKGAPNEKADTGADCATDAAPGDNATSIYPDQGYAQSSGSSVSAARYSNLAGKCLLLDPSLTPDELKHLLSTTSTRSDAWKGKDASGGVIDERAALNAAAQA